MIDHRKFLGAGGSATVLYLGGRSVYDAKRPLVLSPDTEAAALAPGFYSATISGRRATLGAPTEPFDLSSLAPEVGHFAAGYLAGPRGQVATLELLGQAEPEPLAPLRARRHESGALLHHEVLFETEIEGAARERLLTGVGLGGLSGVGATLRFAFAIATTARVARELGLPFSPLEVLPALTDIADRGPDAAHTTLSGLLQRRAEEQERAAARTREAHLRAVGQAARRASQVASARGPRSPEERADAALRAAGATLLGVRDLGGTGRGRSLEVRFRFSGERFTSIVDADTLHVFDAGICLAGADEELTLESLPSVIREAIDDGCLVITRRS